MHNLTLYITKPYRRFGSKVTSQDAFKAIALILMIIDHLGLFFFPQSVIFRVIGRVSPLIWMFFVGYNYKKQTVYSKELIFCAIIVLFFEYFISKDILPLNILFTVIFARIALSLSEKYLTKNIPNIEFLCISICCFCFYFLSNSLFEYGSMGILIAIWGYRIKHKLQNHFQASFVFAFFSFTQAITFKFNFLYTLVAIGLIGFFFFKLFKFEMFECQINGREKYVINILSRYSLWLYSIHYIVFLSLKLILYSIMQSCLEKIIST